MTATSETPAEAGPSADRLARLRNYYATSDESAAIDEAELETDVDPDPMVTTSLRLPRSLLEWVRAQAEHEHVRPTSLMRRWLEERRQQGAANLGPDRLAVIEDRVGELLSLFDVLANEGSLPVSLDATLLPTGRIGAVAKTGEVCPVSGVWAVADAPTVTTPIAKGTRMPAYEGEAVTWRLERLV